MKYTEKNPPMVCMMTQSTCYKGTTKGYPVGVLWHDTGAGNPWLKRYVQPDDNASNRDELIKIIGKNEYNNDFNHIDRQAGLNCWIGKLADGTVSTIQTMPWDFRPWGCGSGKNGSCNGKTGGPFWIQFEICDDSWSNSQNKYIKNSESYFRAAFKEACEITAYLCKKFNIDPQGTVNYNGVTVPTILCHYDSYTLGLGSGHTDIYGWFNLYNVDMENARKQVASLMKGSDVVSNEMYRIRLSWDNKASQVGAYSVLENAISNCPVGYRVYNSSGNEVYYNKEKNVSDDNQSVFSDEINNWLDDRSKQEPSSWSKVAREWAEENGIVKGDSSGYISYKSFITKEEEIVMLKRLYDLIKNS